MLLVFRNFKVERVGIWFKENVNCEIVLCNRDTNGRLLRVTANYY